MADTSQGEGWWQASDDLWYRPELHPDYEPSPRQPVPTMVVGYESPSRLTRSEVLASSRRNVQHASMLILGGGVGIQHDNCCTPHGREHDEQCDCKPQRFKHAEVNTFRRHDKCPEVSCARDPASNRNQPSWSCGDHPE